MEAVLRYDGASDRDDVTPSARLQLVREATASVVAGAVMDVETAGRLIQPELESYGEVIAAVEQNVAGLLVRGEGESFTERVGELMEAWGMSDEARRYHRHLAAAFEHKRVFLKLEWCEVDCRVERQIAVYYRRRPHVHEALQILTRFAGYGLSVDALRELGSILGKDTVHFVAFTARPDRPLWHKFYFSQYVTAESYARVEARLQRAAGCTTASSGSVARWTVYQDRLAPPYRPCTLFVSRAISEDGVDDSIKIDYPEVPPVIAAGLLDGAEAERAGSRLRRLCDAAGRQALSYLGVRIGAGSRLVLKGYADFP
ncbi:MAG: hypothetical protein AB7G48_14350 [Nitrospiraceae bacterium]